MMSSIVDVVLFAALLITTVCVVQMYRKLKRLDAYHEDYQRIFTETAAALNSARDAVRAFHDEGRDTVAQLGREIEEARRVIAEIDARRPPPPGGERSAARPGEVGR